MYTFWPSGDARTSATFYDNIACAAAAAIDLGVYNSELGTLRGYLADIQNELALYNVSITKNLDPCSNLESALTALTVAANYVAGTSLAANSQSGAILPILTALAYTHISVLNELYLFAPSCSGIGAQVEKSAQTLVSVYVGYMCAFETAWAAFKEWRPGQCSYVGMVMRDGTFCVVCAEMTIINRSGLLSEWESCCYTSY